VKALGPNCGHPNGSYHFFFAVSLRLILLVFLFSGGGIAKDFIPERYKN
jgi:hypothetical protein